MSYVWCHGPSCHTYSTQDRVRGSKGSKVLRTRKVKQTEWNSGDRLNMYSYFCSMGCYNDYAYKYAGLKTKTAILNLDQKQSDKIFRDINIEINGFYFLNYLAYWALRLGGWFAWNKHRKKQGD